MDIAWYILGVLTGAIAYALYLFSKKSSLNWFLLSCLMAGSFLILFSIAWAVGSVLEGVPRAAGMGLLVGKITTMKNANEFAGGEGRTQFINFQFLFPAVYAQLAPYSTLAVGAVVMPSERFQFTSILMNTTDSSTTTGFGDIGDGATWLNSIDVQYEVLGARINRCSSNSSSPDRGGRRNGRFMIHHINRTFWKCQLKYSGTYVLYH